MVSSRFDLSYVCFGLYQDDSEHWFDINIIGRRKNALLEAIFKIDILGLY